MDGLALDAAYQLSIEAGRQTVGKDPTRRKQRRY